MCKNGIKKKYKRNVSWPINKTELVLIKGKKVFVMDKNDYTHSNIFRNYFS